LLLRLRPQRFAGGKRQQQLLLRLDQLHRPLEQLILRSRRGYRLDCLFTLLEGFHERTEAFSHLLRGKGIPGLAKEIMDLKAAMRYFMTFSDMILAFINSKQVSASICWI